MKKLLLLAFVSTNAIAVDLMICNGEFALCAASASVPTGKSIRVAGTEFQEGMAVCPVLTGKAIANSSLMKGSCKAPAGKVWSLFSTVTEYRHLLDCRTDDPSSVPASRARTGGGVGSGRRGHG